MITRDQMHTLAKARYPQSGINFFSKLPLDLVLAICDNYEKEIESDIAKALHYAAYARKEDVEALLAMLDADPKLLLQAGNVKTPGGDEVRRVTPYEFLLGAGDYELAKSVQAYFSKIENGEQERLSQYERYRPHIEGILTERPYDVAPLIELIKKAPQENILALLDKDFSGENDLCKAIIQFHKDWAPRILRKPCMHYNYASLQHAFKLFSDEIDDLLKESENSYVRINLVWRQLIGFEMRRLPGIDRCVMAQGLRVVMQENQVVRRSYSFKNDSDHRFPITLVDDFLSDLGGDFGIGIYGRRAGIPGILGLSYPFEAEALLENLRRTKTSNLQSLCSDIQHGNRVGL